MILCFRCGGRKKMYKIGGGWVSSYTGGPALDCPMCLGVGMIKSEEEQLNEINEAKEVVEIKKKVKTLGHIKDETGN